MLAAEAVLNTAVVPGNVLKSEAVLKLTNEAVRVDGVMLVYAVLVLVLLLVVVVDVLEVVVVRVVVLVLVVRVAGLVEIISVKLV